MTRRLLALAGVLLVFALALAAMVGCSSEQPAPTENPKFLEVWWVDLGDGTEVRCVIYAADRRGGASCDWAHIRPRAQP